jgi:ribonuclease T1
MNKKIIARLIIVGTLLAVAWFVRSRQNQQQASIAEGRPKTTQTQGKSSQNPNKSVEIKGAAKSSPKSADVPQYVQEILQYVRAYGEAPGGYVGGREFQNREKRLPSKASDGKKIRYSEWDVHPKKDGQNRGAERLVTGSDHSAWYTKDHYKNFVKVE